MLLDERGLDLSGFEPVFASTLGSDQGEAGCKLVAIAVSQGHARVQLRDWLYCLAEAPGTELRKRLIDAAGKTAQRFVHAVEEAVSDGDEPADLPIARLTRDTVAPDVVAMLEAAERIARENACRNINDAVVTLALLEVADESLRGALTAWATEQGLAAFTAQLRGKIAPADETDVLAADGRLDPGCFDGRGRKLLQRLREDAASIGAGKVTTRHLLYTLLGNESGLLPTALAIRGVDVKKELLPVLMRQLARPGARRTEGFELTRETLFAAVVQLFRDARRIARERGARRIGEFDVGKAFLLKQPQELARLFPPTRPLDLAGLREYVESTRAEEEDEAESPVRRFTIREMEEHIRRRIIGQDEAVAKILPWIKRLRFGLPRTGRPAGVFLFLGPTGSGKTQLAKELARYVFGDEDMMIYLEMGQFQTRESMNMFVGAPPGYVGYGDGKLTNGLKDKPESVVLFDEIEKAHTQVFDALLRFADEGLISDPAGPVRDGRKCIIVMTTNAGQQWLRDHLKADPEARNDPRALAGQLFDEALKELKSKGFRPEFLGRVDEKVVFLPFTLATCRRIVDAVLEQELGQIQRLKNVTVEVDEDARNTLAMEVFERAMEEGARGAPRAVNEHIINPLIDRVSAAGGDDGAAAPTRATASGKGLERIVVEVEA